MTSSMTGYGVAEGPLGGGRLTIELRTVNHRYFNGQFRLPLSLQPFESELRTRLRERLERGNVTVRAHWIEPPPRSVSVKLNLDRAQAVISALTELKTALNLAGEIDLGFVARQPDVLTLPDDDELDVDRGELVTLLDRALADVVQMRKREGAVLGADLERRLTTLEQRLTDVEARAPQRLEAERGRLRRAVSDLLDGKPVDDNRLLQEIALLADKLDISEEIVRLRAHIQACRETLAGESAAGRTLAFFGQEMLREINTIGSKANDARITNTVVAMKGELEKYREQVENIE